MMEEHLLQYQPLQMGNDVCLYQEQPPIKHLRPWVQSYWQMSLQQGFHNYRPLPDACVDLIINLTNPEECFLVPPFSAAVHIPLVGPVSFFHIRFTLFGPCWTDTSASDRLDAD